jgi:hypothetical protein
LPPFGGYEVIKKGIILVHIGKEGFESSGLCVDEEDTNEGSSRKNLLIKHKKCRVTKKGEKSKPMYRRISIGLMGLVMMWPVLLSAQDKPVDNMQVIIEKARADKRFLIAENMELTKAEAKAFWPIYEKYQNELSRLCSLIMIMIDKYSKAYEKMTEETARNLLDEYMTIETLRLKLLQTYLPKFQEVLPVVKALRYFQIENKIYSGVMYEFASNIPLIKNTK